VSRTLPLTWLAPGLAVAVLVLVAAPEAETGPCTHRDALIAEFEVSPRAAIVEAVPALRNAPELVGENGVLQDGEPVYPDIADYHVALYRCLEYGLLPLWPPLTPGFEPPAVIYNVVTTGMESGVTIYSDVDFSRLRIPRPESTI
jgi:hypothetical protein